MASPLSLVPKDSLPVVKSPGVSAVMTWQSHGWQPLTVQTDTQSGQDHGQIVADVVDILLCGYKFVESDDTITA